MNTHADKTVENKSISILHAVSQNKSANESTFQFVDNRPEANQVRQLQGMANSSSRTMQLRSFQEMVDKKNNPIQFNGRKRSFSEAFGDDYISEYEPPRKRRRLLGVRRLRRTYLRNKNRKAIPSNQRDVFGRQQLHNYGYKNKVIDYGSVKGDFYKGPFVNQPYLRIDKDDYGLNVKPKTNYDDIVRSLERFGNDSELATIIMEKIIEGTELPDDMDKTVKANVSLLIQLTQFIEPHELRVPGIDKLARSFLRNIASGKMTFRQVFNRKNGLFVVARAKGGGSKYGGQESGRTLVGMPAKKSDKSTFDEMWTREIDRVSDEMSDSSDEE